jgi:hypothetical protein
MQNKRISELGTTGTIAASDLLLTSEYNGTAYDSRNITGQDAAQSLRLLAPVLWTVDLMDSTSIDIYAPYTMSIDTVVNLVNAPTTTILYGGAPYTLGDYIGGGVLINITVSTAAVLNLNITQII